MFAEKMILEDKNTRIGAIKDGYFVKWKNKKVLIAKIDSGFIFQFRKTMDINEPVIESFKVKDKALFSTMTLTQEASEATMFMLAELLGYNVSKKS